MAGARFGQFMKMCHSSLMLTPIVSKSQFPSKALCRQKLMSHIGNGQRRVCLQNYSIRSKMSTDDVLKGLDETQVKLMQEECILVDKDDLNIGSASKKTCHLLENINKGMLHRAFSVFLFNSKGDLLLQQRASEKITFPDHFTNTCCSHPLNFEAELEEEGAIGVKRAAQRKLEHELGIVPKQVPLEDFHYLTRILYKAENVPKDGKWGEHEIDYILFIQRDVTVKANPNEVKSYRYVSQRELKDLIDSSETDGMLLTPWFKLICNNFLFKWWNKLNDIESQADRKVIHVMS
ncbi:hypothetical protein EGW08_000372 [Elysia chlorotica]|uniref:isopentenyl-diphosphate Delta-isomerase n=1 Tax=Elysia chlorotica TaxID=188477 RepID=A0A3S1BMN5_ELYCH|nr:hypothetical protein EGW08_000372 [Elysia chlorotica]